MEEKRYLTASLVLYKNNRNQLVKLIESLPMDLVNLIIIDNSPTDKLSDLFVGLKSFYYYFLGRNIGFGKAHNLAFDKVKDKSEYHFVLNPDVYFDKTVINDAVKFLDSDKSIGVVGPKIYYPSGVLQFSCRLLPSPFDLFVRRFANKSYKIKRDKRNELQFTGYDCIMSVPFLLGCFLAFRSEVFEKIGGFDDRYFMYLEDADLCRKVLSSNKVVFNPELKIFHTYAKGSSKSVKLFWIHLLSSVRYFNKWGWFFDFQRRRLNKKTLNNLGYKKD